MVYYCFNHIKSIYGTPPIDHPTSPHEVDVIAWLPSYFLFESMLVSGSCVAPWHQGRRIDCEMMMLGKFRENSSQSINIDNNMLVLYHYIIYIIVLIYAISQSII